MFFACRVKQFNYTCTRALIPFDSQSNAKVDVYVLLVVVNGLESLKLIECFPFLYFSFYIAVREMKCFVRLYVNLVFPA